MKIGGFHKLSLSDFPGQRAAVIYTQGCNWRCPYCLYRSLVIPTRFQPSLPELEILSYLEGHRFELDAVVVSGGEPCLQPDLVDFLRRLKRLGYAIKLETHGGRPAVLAQIFEEKLVDFVAMDLKGPLNDYARFIGCEIDPGVIELSLDLIRQSGVPSEVRSTLVGGLHTAEDLRRMAPVLAGSRRVALQTYRTPPGAKPGPLSVPDGELFHVAGELLRDHVEELIIR